MNGGSAPGLLLGVLCAAGLAAGPGAFAGRPEPRKEGRGVKLFSDAIFARLPADTAAINYSHHACVLLRWRRLLLLFDYAVPAPFDAAQFLHVRPWKDLRGYAVYVLASHAHGDHFTPRLFELAPRENLHFVLSHDIAVPETKHHVLVARPGKWVRHGKVEVFGTPASDAGLAFLVKADGLTVYFSGDNAFWDWENERRAERDFAPWLKPVADLGLPIDVAFQVADPRCHASHYGGIHDVSRFLDIGLLVPIHNFGDFSHQERIRDLVARKHPKQTYWDIRGNDAFRLYKPARPGGR